MAEVYGHEPQYRTVRQAGFKGIVDGVAEDLLEDGESPRALNIEFDRGSIATTRGCRKFNNQTAPSSGIRTRAPQSLPPLYIASGLSVPVRGYVYHPYDQNYDIGGRPD